MIALIARGELTYHGRTVSAGELFEAVPIDAAVLRYHRQVDFAPRGARIAAPSPPPAVQTIAPPPEATEQDLAKLKQDRDEGTKPKPRPRRMYRRRDLEAEDSCNSSD